MTLSHTSQGRARQALILALSLAVCFAVAGVGWLFTTPALGEWYAGLRKPPGTPPDWVFAPVWSTLYAMLAVSAWLVWRRGGPGMPLALRLFAVQLVLNAGWSAIFFGWRSPGAALGEILLLWVAIGATLVQFARLSRPAALLLVPYFFWVGFAVFLNVGFWRLNG